MKKPLGIAAVCFMVLAGVYFALKWPLIAVIQFEARGEFGDETIRVTKGAGGAVLLDETAVGKEWKKFYLETFGPLRDIRIHYLNSPKSPDSPRLLYIHNGIVKLYKKNIFGHVLARKDLLNIDTKYFDLNGQLLFKADSIPMATVRGGITGWAGYYELYP